MALRLLHTFSSSAPSRRSHFSLLTSSSCHSGQTRNPGINCWLSEPAGEAGLKQWYLSFYVDSSFHLSLLLNHIMLVCWFRDSIYKLWSTHIYFLSVTTSLTRRAGGVGSAFSLIDPWTLQLVLKNNYWTLALAWLDWCHTQCCFAATLYPRSYSILYPDTLL